MKIISKYKDYYDYLVGTYGEDPKLILDRREGFILSKYSTECKYQLYICGKIIDIYYKDCNYYYGVEIKEFDNFEYSKWYKKRDDIVMINRMKFNIFPYDDPDDINNKENCPIILKSGNMYTKFPRLIDMEFPRYMEADIIYQKLIDWYSNQIDKKLIIEDNLTDVDKLLNKGFDKIYSFRPKIKN